MGESLSSLSYHKILESNRAELCNYDEVLDIIRESLKKNNIDAEVVLGGSVAKGTFLKDYDLDVFVRFKEKVDVDALQKLLKSVFKVVSRIHGSRDYFHLIYKNKNYEIVPVLLISKAQDAENITDVSYFHVNWVKENLKNPDQARLLKIFAKSQGFYGAESHINGFSGYILELLIIHYGSFQKLIEEASKWSPKVIIDIAKLYKSKKNLLNELNISKKQSPLILIDPVQKERNAAAALSLDVFSRFVNAAREFGKSPDQSFFVKKAFSSKEIRNRAKKYDLALDILKINLIDGKKDIVLTKALMAFNFLKKQLLHYGFQIVDSRYEYDEHIFWFLTSPKNLPKYEVRKGPELWSDDKRVESFKDKHKEIFLDEGVLKTLVERNYTSSRSLLKNLILKEEVANRLAKIRFKNF